MAKYKCKVCGYIHEGNKAPDVCPVCAAPASDFEEMKDEAAADKKKGLDRDSNVYTVVYASVMVVLVAVVLAFTSQSLRTFQQKNEENDKRQQILRSINVTVPANEAEAKYSELIKEAFLVNENGEKVDNGNNNYFNYPYWGFNKVRNDKNNDRDWVEKIKTKAQVKTLHDDSDGSFLSWGSTTNGFEDLKEYVLAAIKLKYMV